MVTGFASVAFGVTFTSSASAASSTPEANAPHLRALPFAPAAGAAITPATSASAAPAAARRAIRTEVIGIPPCPFPASLPWFEGFVPLPNRLQTSGRATGGPKPARRCDENAVLRRLCARVLGVVGDVAEPDLDLELSAFAEPVLNVDGPAAAVGG